MKSKIVERLRARWESSMAKSGCAESLDREAANEIERLQVIVEKLPRQPNGEYLQCPLCRQYLDLDGTCPEGCGDIGRWLDQIDLTRLKEKREPKKAVDDSPTQAQSDTEEERLASQIDRQLSHRAIQNVEHSLDGNALLNEAAVARLAARCQRKYNIIRKR